MANINEFIQGFAGGGARANRFQVTITWPALAGTPNVADSIVVHAAQLPSSLMGVVQLPYLGRMVPLIGDRTFEPWTIQVYNDTSFSHRASFERWMNAMNSHAGNVQATPNYQSLVTTINVSQLGKDGSILKTYALLNAWPSQLSPIDVGYDQNDSVEQYTVTFEYSHYTTDTTT